MAAALIMAMCCFAAAQEELFYLRDQADILPKELKEDILSRGEALYEQTGCQLAVVTADFLGGKSIEDYAEDIFTKEQIGRGKNRGLLLLFCTGEEHYYALAGQGLSDVLSSGELKAMLDSCAEPGFEAGDYENAVSSCYYAAVSHLEEKYSVSTDAEAFAAYKAALEEEKERARREKLITLCILAAFAAITVILFIRFVIILFFSVSNRPKQPRNIF